MHWLRTELILITSPEVRAFVEAAWQRAPRYFWTVTSSTTGKTHPPDERGPGGRVLHTKRVARLAHDLARVHNLTAEESDLLTAAALIHDLIVNGPEKEPLERNWPQHDVALRGYLTDLQGMLAPMLWATIFNACDGHMGRWGSDAKAHAAPGTFAHLLHIADVVASRSWVNVEPLPAGN